MAQAPKFQEDLIDMTESLWKLRDTNYDHTLNLIIRLISDNEISVFNIIDAIDLASIWNCKSIKLYVDLCISICNRKPLIGKKYFNNKMLQALLVKKGIIGLEIPLNFVNYSENQIYTYNFKNKIMQSIIFDDINSLHVLTATSAFDYNQTINYANLLDISATFGAVNCFKYIYLNHAKITITTLENAFLGNNFEIVRICIQNINNISPRCIENAIKAHNFDLVEYLSLIHI